MPKLYVWKKGDVSINLEFEIHVRNYWITIKGMAKEESKIKKFKLILITGIESLIHHNFTN